MKPAAEVFLDDASSGLNAVLRSLPWQPQDVMLLTSAAYAVLPNTGKWLQKRYGIQILQAEVYHGCKHGYGSCGLVWLNMYILTFFLLRLCVSDALRVTTASLSLPSEVVTR